MKTDLETTFLKSDERPGSRKIRIGDKWLIVFWCGMFVSECDITTGYADTSPEHAERLKAMWQAWCENARMPLVLGSMMIAADGVSPIRLQQFLLPDGSSIYLRKKVLKFLPDDEGLSHSCIRIDKDTRALLVTNANSEVVAIFSEIVPRGPIKGEQP